MRFVSSMTNAQLRKQAGYSRERAGAATGTTAATVRLYEASRDAVRDDRKRAALDALYAQFANGTAASPVLAARMPRHPFRGGGRGIRAEKHNEAASS